MANKAQIHYFGIRHHGPGSARSLLHALEALSPDCVLVEGPPDAESVLPLIANEAMVPPVALLVYVPERPRSAVFYPFATFSPEWQALRFALAREIPARFIDLPQAHRLALDEKEGKDAEDEANAKNKDTEEDSTVAGGSAEGGDPFVAEEGVEEAGAEEKAGKSPADATVGNLQRDERDDETADSPEGSEERPDREMERLRFDPLGWMGRAAGFADGEEWWEQMVERRRDASEVFAAIREAMTTLRAEAPPRDDTKEERREALREAYMRKRIREAEREGFERIAVVCGAWHVPALMDPPSVKHDNDLLKGMPRTKVAATWAPWTFGRLSVATGYGAGIESPGWYDHLWSTEGPFAEPPTGQEPPIADAGRDKSVSGPPALESLPNDDFSRVATGWLIRVARLLRDEDLDVSSAHVIEGIRLAEALAALRNRPQPGLPELMEATQTIFCFGDDTPLRLIHDKLIVGDRIGHVPDDAPIVPIQQDLQREQKRLRLPPRAFEKVYDLDLRKSNDLDRSRLLHRLLLLDIPWGRLVNVAGKKGTFHEVWALQWQPELAVSLIEASVWGSSVGEAATRFACDAAERAETLPPLTALVDRVLLADLPNAVRRVMDRLEAVAALAGDVPQLMEALPPLANIMRYGNVRQTDAALVSHVVDGLVTRIGIGLSGACGSLDDDAARAMFNRVSDVNMAIRLLQSEEYDTLWKTALMHLTETGLVHGLVSGRACRLLLDGQALTPEETARRMGLALSPGGEPDRAGAWVEGFLFGSGMVLLHDDVLWSVLDGWVSSLSAETFMRVVPLLRRTFSTFPAPERRQMGERVKRVGPRIAAAHSAGEEEDSNLFDRARADRVLPLLSRLLGIEASPGIPDIHSPTEKGP